MEAEHPDVHTDSTFLYNIIVFHVLQEILQYGRSFEVEKILSDERYQTLKVSGWKTNQPLVWFSPSRSCETALICRLSSKRLNANNPFREEPVTSEHVSLITVLSFVSCQLFTSVFGVGPKTAEKWYRRGLRSFSVVLAEPSIHLNRMQQSGTSTSLCLHSATSQITAPVASRRSSKSRSLHSPRRGVCMSFFFFWGRNMTSGEFIVTAQWYRQQGDFCMKRNQCTESVRGSAYCGTHACSSISQAERGHQPRLLPHSGALWFVCAKCKRALANFFLSSITSLRSDHFKAQREFSPNSKPLCDQSNAADWLLLYYWLIKQSMHPNNLWTNQSINHSHNLSNNSCNKSEMLSSWHHLFVEWGNSYNKCITDTLQ